MIITTHGTSYEITTEAQLIQWLAQRSPEAMAKFLATLPAVPVRSYAPFADISDSSKRDKQLACWRRSA